jgi:hypothetical protein
LSQTKNKVIDWTLYRLVKSIEEKARKGDEAEASILETTLSLYADGLVNIEWAHGEPLISLSPEAKIMIDVLNMDVKGDAK